MASVDIDRSISWEDAMAIHNAIHQKRAGVSVDVEGIKYPVGKAKNGCWTCVVKGISCMEQNPKKGSKFGQMARNGARLTWFLSTPRWALIRDGQYEQKSWFVREPQRGKSGSSPAKRKLPSKMMQSIAASDDDDDDSKSAKKKTKKRRVKSESEQSDDDSDSDDAKTKKKRAATTKTTTRRRAATKVKKEESSDDDSDDDDGSDEDSREPGRRKSTRTSGRRSVKKEKDEKEEKEGKQSDRSSSKRNKRTVKTEGSGDQAAGTMTMLADGFDALDNMSVTDLERIEKQAAALRQKRVTSAPPAAAAAAAAMAPPQVKIEGVGDAATVAYPNGNNTAADMPTIGYQGNTPSSSHSRSHSGGASLPPPLDHPTVAFPTMSALADSLPPAAAAGEPSSPHPLAPVRRRISNELQSPRAPVVASNPSVAGAMAMVNAQPAAAAAASSAPAAAVIVNTNSGPSAPPAAASASIAMPPPPAPPRVPMPPPPPAAPAAPAGGVPMVKRKKRKPVTAEATAARKKHIAQWLIPYADLQMEIRLGSGAFGEVRRAIWQHTVVAVKILHKGDEKAMTMFLKEAVLLCKMHHPCIVRTFGVTEEPPCIIMEFLPQDLWGYIKQHGALLAMDTFLPIAIDIAKGISYLHHQTPQIIHRDLKPANILLDSHRHAKVADFGISFENHDTTQMTACGTPHYMAPELVSEQKYTSKVDVYAFGMIMWVMLTAKIPFQGLRPLQVMMKVTTEKFRPTLPRDVAPAPICDLIESCWTHDPANRPDMDDVITVLQQLLPQYVPPNNAAAPIAAAPPAAASNNNDNKAMVPAAVIAAAVPSPSALVVAATPVASSAAATAAAVAESRRPAPTVEIAETAILNPATKVKDEAAVPSSSSASSSSSSSSGSSSDTPAPAKKILRAKRTTAASKKAAASASTSSDNNDNDDDNDSNDNTNPSDVSSSVASMATSSSEESAATRVPTRQTRSTTRQQRTSPTNATPQLLESAA